jgi:hypothetical protein
MRWATRSGVHVDRAASAWLIRRHIDPDAIFVFVDDPTTCPTTRPRSTCAVSSGHHGSDYSFETILQHFGLTDPVLWDLARLIHEADLADERFDAPEASGLDVICRGLSMVRDDDAILSITEAMFDGLYEYRRRALLLGREPS